MQIQFDHIHQLADELYKLSLQLTPPPQITNQQDYLIAKAMPWQQNPSMTDQYNHLYLDRMKKLGAKVQMKGGVKRIEQLQEKLGNVNIIGMIKRLQVRRKRAFEKGFEEYYKTAEKIYSEEDDMELEDPSGRVKFRFSKKAKLPNKIFSEIDLPHGIIAGFNGSYSEKENKFIVLSIVLPDLAPQNHLDKAKEQSTSKILVVSKPSLHDIKNILEEITEKQECFYANSMINSIVMIGLSQDFTPNDFRQADKLFENYSQKINIFMMPEPHNNQIPQRPYHPMKFKKSCGEICLCSNPQTFTNTSNELSLLFFDSINLKDLKKNCAYSQEELQLMKSLLVFSHFSPTSPFSLRCQVMPSDYFIIDQLPHLMLATNCNSQKVADFTKDDKIVRLVTMQRNSLLLIDQKTLQVCKFTINGCKQLKQAENMLEIEE